MKNQYQRRDFLKLALLSPVIVYTPQSQAFIVPLFRFLLRAMVRGGGRTMRRSYRPTRMLPVNTSRNAYGRMVEQVWDGYVAIDSISAFAAVDNSIHAVSHQVASQAQTHNADTLWQAGKQNRIQLDFFNDSPKVIPAPDVYFEQLNLETGEQFKRPHPLRFAHDWQPGVRGSIPADTYSVQEMLPMTIHETGPIAIRPFIPNQPDVIFDQFIVVVGQSSDIQWKRG